MATRNKARNPNLALGNAFRRLTEKLGPGIRAGMAVLRRWWNTYHYVPTRLVVAIADCDAIYSDDTH